MQRMHQDVIKYGILGAGATGFLLFGTARSGSTCNLLLPAANILYVKACL
jgi:hypothetical protein